MQAYREIVCERLSDTNRALSGTNYTVHLCSPILVEAMEVQACCSIAKVVLQIDDDAISHVGDNPGNWPLAIYTHYRAWLQTIRVGCDPGDIEIVRERGSVGEDTKAQKRDDAWREHVGPVGGNVRPRFVLSEISKTDSYVQESRPVAPH